MPESEVEAIREDLAESQLRTGTDDTLYAEAVDLREISGGAELELEIELPNGDTETFQFDYPQPWTEEFDFVRLLRSLGYEAISLNEFIGTDVPVRRYGDTWELDIPEPESEGDTDDGEEIPPVVALGLLVGGVYLAGLWTPTILAFFADFATTAGSILVEDANTVVTNVTSEESDQTLSVVEILFIFLPGLVSIHFMVQLLGGDRRV